MPWSTGTAGSAAEEQRINKPMTFAEVQGFGRAEGERRGSTAVPSPGLDDSSIKSQRPVVCRQTCCVLVFQHNQEFSENRTLVWHCRLTRVTSYQVMSAEMQKDTIKTSQGTR